MVGMQRLAPEPRREGAGIGEIRDQRMPDKRHVNPDLVCSAGVQRTTHQTPLLPVP